MQLGSKKVENSFPSALKSELKALIHKVMCPPKQIVTASSQLTDTRAIFYGVRADGSCNKSTLIEFISQHENAQSKPSLPLNVHCAVDIKLLNFKFLRFASKLSSFPIETGKVLRQSSTEYFNALLTHMEFLHAFSAGPSNSLTH